MWFVVQGHKLFEHKLLFKMRLITINCLNTDLLTTCEKRGIIFKHKIHIFHYKDNMRLPLKQINIAVWPCHFHFVFASGKSGFFSTYSNVNVKSYVKDSYTKQLSM